MTTFRRLPTTFRRFPKIFQNCSEGLTNVSEHFSNIFRRLPKIAEDIRKLPKEAEDFRGGTDDVSIIQPTSEYFLSDYVAIAMPILRVCLCKSGPVDFALLTDLAHLLCVEWHSCAYTKTTIRLIGSLYLVSELVQVNPDNSLAECE